MRVALSVVLLLLVFSTHLIAQQTAAPAPQPLQRDAQAIAIIQASLNVMGNSQALALQDCVASGQAQIFKPDGTSVTMPVVKRSKGTGMVRTELQRPEGTRVRIVNGGVGATQNPDGTVRRHFSNNTIAERVEHIPALSILSEWQSTIIEIRYIGTDSVNGSPVQVVALSLIPTSDPKRAGLYRTATQTFFYIDQSTNLVSKIRYQNFAENDSNVSETTEVVFSNYQTVNGVLVPFVQSTVADGRLRSTITFTNVTFNTGLLDSAFSVPGGN